MNKKTIGLIPSPGLPAELTSKLVDDLPNFLSHHVDHSVRWESETLIDPIVGSAEYMNQLMNKVIHLKHKNDWDYVICLTDLPYFHEKNAVIAEVSTTNLFSLISIPALGTFSMKHQTTMMISRIINDMHYPKKLDTLQINRQRYEKKSLSFFINKINLDHKNEKDNSEEQAQVKTLDKSDIQYMINYKLIGRLRVLAGMTIANRPWTALISFRKILMIAFGTGIYITLFPSSWELSIIYSIPRFILLMFAAIFGMVTWIIFAHQLWEKPTQKGDARLRTLYNHTTIITLIIIVLINYIVLFLFL